MRRRVGWSAGALADIADTIAHISADDPDAAQSVVDRIRKSGVTLGDFATGHIGRVSGTYEKSVRGLPYILVYELKDAARTMSIVRVIHTARDWPDGEWPEG